MLAGAPPLTGDTPLAVAMQHLNQRPSRSRSSGPMCRARWPDVIHRMLAKKPADRFADPAEFTARAARTGEGGCGKRLGDGAAGLVAGGLDRRGRRSGGGHVALGSGDEDQRARRPSRGRRARRWIAAVVAGLLLLGAAAGLATRPRSLVADATSGSPSLHSMWAQLYQAKMVDTEGGVGSGPASFSAGRSVLPQSRQAGTRATTICFVPKMIKTMMLPVDRCSDLAQLGTSNPSLAAFGIAGLVVAEAKLGNTAAARDENSRLDQRNAGGFGAAGRRNWPSCWKKRCAISIRRRGDDESLSGGYLGGRGTASPSGALARQGDLLAGRWRRCCTPAGRLSRLVQFDVRRGSPAGGRGRSSCR